MKEVAHMLITKKVQIKFADPDIQAIDHIQDLRKAIAYAGLNLYSRHEIRLEGPMLTEDDRVVIEIKIPEKEVGNCSNIGNRLRGISVYLLRQYKEKYERHCIGKRLLIYIEMDESDQESTGSPKQESTNVQELDPLKAIIAFTKLLERDDPEALDRIRRILSILNES